MRPMLSLVCRASRRGACPGARSALAAKATGCSASSALVLPSSRRTLLGLSFGWFKKPEQPKPRPERQPLLTQDDLFHPLSTSPIEALRKRAEVIKSMAPCPVTLNRDGVRKLVKFDCPDCGWPTHYSEKEWREDAEHAQYVPRLREANEDEHDLRSGRAVPEFDLPGFQAQDEVINFSTWDVFFYTRNHASIDSDRARRHASKLLSFPITIAGVLHEHSPYTRRSGRLTHEGLRSLVALRQTLHPALGSKPSLDVMRIFIVGARAESTLPAHVWDQLRFIFQGVALHIYMIGPEVTLPKEDAPTNFMGQRKRSANFGVPASSTAISEGLTITLIQCNYEQVHSLLEPFDPYTDIYFCFSPGFGFPSVQGQDEIDKARWEAYDDDARMKSARETYHARRSDDGAVLTEEEGKNEQVLHPVGGDTPSAEPPQPRLMTNAEMPHGRYTSLTTAPIVQAQREWATALGQMLSTKCALVSTGFSPADMERDILAFESVEGIQGEFEWLVNPGENAFASNSWVIADFDPRVAVKANWGIWAVRGKRYDIQGPNQWSGGWRGSEEE